MCGAYFYYFLSIDLFSWDWGGNIYKSFYSGVFFILFLSYFILFYFFPVWGEVITIQTLTFRGVRASCAPLASERGVR